MIVHAVPKFIRSVYAAGNWKAVESNNLALSETEKPFEVVEFDETNPLEFLKHCNKNVKHLIVEYSLWPELAEEITRKAPWVKLHIRTHNAQGFQHWHRSYFTFRPTYNNLRILYGVLRLIWRDMRCRRAADTLLGISDWDNRNYWKYLPGRAKIKSLPYFSPWPYIESDISPLPWEEREQTIVCMPGARDPISTTMIQGLNILSQKMSNETSKPKWRFLLTRGIMQSDKEVSLSDNVELIEDVKKPYELLCKSKVVAVLTPLGFGMKTTIIDALAAGCHILVHPKLAQRLPDELRKICILYNPDKRRNLEELNQKLRLPPPQSFIDYNKHLRQSAISVLKQTLI